MGDNAPAVGRDEPRPRIRRQGGAAWGNVSPHVMGEANWGGMDDGLDGVGPADGWGPVSLSAKPGSSWSLPRAMVGPPTDARRQLMLASCRWAATPRLSGWMSRGPGYGGRAGPHGGNVSSYAMGGANWGFMDDGLDGVRPVDGWGPVSLSTKPGSSGSLPRAMGGAASGVSEVRATSEFAPCDGGP